MANISEKNISILAGNLNLGYSYLITTVLSIYNFEGDPKNAAFLHTT